MREESFSVRITGLGPSPDNNLEARVLAACGRILAEHGQVSTLDMLLGARIIHWGHVNQWKMGLVPYLEKVTLTRHEDWGRALETFHRWGESRGLRRVLAEYRMKNRTGEQYLRFTDTCDKVVEDLYRIAYASREPFHAPPEPPAEPTVWEVMRRCGWLASLAPCGVPCRPAAWPC